MKLDWTTGALAEGLRCYRNEEYFAAHEHWEAVWLAAEEPEKTLLQGIIQVTAAFHHLRRGNRRGAASLLAAAILRLSSYPEAFAGIAVPALCLELRECVAALDAADDFSTVGAPPIRVMSGMSETDERAGG